MPKNKPRFVLTRRMTVRDDGKTVVHQPSRLNVFLWLRDKYDQDVHLPKLTAIKEQTWLIREAGTHEFTVTTTEGTETCRFVIEPVTVRFTVTIHRPTSQIGTSLDLRRTLDVADILAAFQGKYHGLRAFPQIERVDPWNGGPITEIGEYELILHTTAGQEPCLCRVQSDGSESPCLP